MFINIQIIVASLPFKNYQRLGLPKYETQKIDKLDFIKIKSFLLTVACQAGLSMEFSRQEYWSGLSFPPPEDLPSSGIKRTSPELAGRFFTVGTPCVGDIATSFLLGALGCRPLCEQPLLGPPCGWGCPAPSCRILTPRHHSSHGGA